MGKAMSLEVKWSLLYLKAKLRPHRVHLLVAGKDAGLGLANARFYLRDLPALQLDEASQGLLDQRIAVPAG